MGAATYILSDKTGTLTQNKMKVSQAYFFDEEFANIDTALISNNKKTLIAEVLSRNTTAYLKKSKSKVEFIGNKTEGALLELLENWGYNYSDYRNPENQQHEFGFTSSTKRMTTIYSTQSEGTSVYTKGAAETVLECSDFYISKTEEILPLTKEKKSKIKELVKIYSNNSLRVLGIAYKRTTLDQVKTEDFDQEKSEKELIFLGFVGIEDPLRPEAKESILKAKNAGVNVKMITGDNLETAISIAKQAGFLPDVPLSVLYGEYVMKGKQFRERVGGLITNINSKGIVTSFKVGNLSEFKKIYKNLVVIARCSPEDKLLMVIGLKEVNEVVGVTGDGSNDAAALKHSDIGLAMMSGTRLAKESSDIILLDDNFESVVNAIKWGRNVYASLRKYIQFQLIVNTVALIVTLVGGITEKSSPLTAVQMLWVNLIMDSFAALALSTEAPTMDLMNSQPYGRLEGLINTDMLITMVSQMLFQITLLLFVLYFTPTIFDVENSWDYDPDDWTEENGIHYTIFFNTFVMLQLFNEVNCRKLNLEDVNVFNGLFSNMIFIWIVAGTFAVQILLVEYGGEPMNCAPLTIVEHTFCIVCGVIGLILGIFIRYAVTSYRKKSLIKSSIRETIDYDNFDEAPLVQ